MTLRQTADRVRKEKGYPLHHMKNGINDINISTLVDAMMKRAIEEAKRVAMKLLFMLKTLINLSTRHKLQLCDEIEKGLSEYFVDIFNIDIEYHDGEMYATLEW